MRNDDRFADAVETFVHGYCHGKSETHPYLIERYEALYRLFDADRSNPSKYRKEEWIACRQEPPLVDAFARAHTRGWYFVGAFQAADASDVDLREAYRHLGYRLLATQPFFVHSLTRIPRAEPGPAKIVRVTSKDLAQRLGKAARSRPLSPEYWRLESPVRQYVALQGDEVVGWNRSVVTPRGNWCTNVHVMPRARRQGIGRALLLKMLRDDRQQSARASVLLASQSGALLYPQIGYQQIGSLWIFAPKTAPFASNRSRAGV